MSVGAVLVIALLIIGSIVAIGAIVASLSIRPQRNDRKRANELETLVDTIREIAYTHRELDSNLASIITDEIRTFENRQRKELR